MIIAQYGEAYPELVRNEAYILEQLSLEEDRFQRTLKQGLREFDKVLNNINRVNAAMAALKTAVAEKADTAEALKNAISTLRPTPEMSDMLNTLKAAQESGVCAHGIAADRRHIDRPHRRAAFGRDQRHRVAGGRGRGCVHHRAF